MRKYCSGLAEILKILNRHGIGGAALVPVRRIHRVLHLAAAENGASPVLPVTMIDETDRDRATDTQSFEKDLGRDCSIRGTVREQITRS